MAEAVRCADCGARLVARVDVAYAALQDEALARGLTVALVWPAPVVASPRPARYRGPRQKKAAWWERTRVRMLYPTIG